MSPDTRQPETEEDIVVAISHAIGCEIGDAFLGRVVEVLHRYMRATLVLISVGEGAPINHARAVYALRDGLAATDISYDLPGTPCQLVFERNTELIVPCDLAKQFPREAGLESYIGVPLRDSIGDIHGHLAVFSPDAMTHPDRVSGLVAVLGQRVEAELHRLELEAERERMVDDLMRLTGRLRARQQVIRDQNAYKTRLLGIIAHDLRNPLAAIISQAELAVAHLGRDTPTLDRVEKACTKVMTSAERISSLIDATLDRVREEDGNLNLSPETCDIAALIRLATEANQAEADRKTITLTLDVADDLSARVDEELITQAVDNLISNAVKYTQPGGWVRVAATRQDDGLCITVQDNGQGLSAGDIARAFGRFETLSAKPTGGESSTGLGLSNVKEIVEAHGGALSVESAGIGQGALFSIRLPG